MGFAPIGKIDAAGMKVVDALHSGYGEGAEGRGRNRGSSLRVGIPTSRNTFPS